MPARQSATRRAATAADSDLIGGPPKANPAGMSNPALRALAGIGVTRLSQLTAHREQDIAALHGMGPKVMKALGAALRAQGKSFKG